MSAKTDELFPWCLKTLEMIPQRLRTLLVSFQITIWIQDGFFYILLAHSVCGFMSVSNISEKRMNRCNVPFFEVGPWWKEKKRVGRFWGAPYHKLGREILFALFANSKSDPFSIFVIAMAHDTLYHSYTCCTKTQMYYDFSVKYQIEFKTLLIVFKGLHGKAPTYI